MRERGVMADVESAAVLCERWLPCLCHEGFKSRKLTDPSCPRCNYADDLVDAIAARDTAIRSAARRQAFEEAAENCAFLAASERGKSPDERMGDGSMRVADFLAEHFRALATGSS